MKRLLIVQFAGDFRESDRLRRLTGEETYYGHTYILDQLERFRDQADAVGFLCGLAPPYHEVLPSGVTVIGAGADFYRDPGPVLRAVEAFDPTHLIVCGPMMALIRWGLARRIHLGVLLADSFAGLYDRWWRFRRLPALLNDPGVTLVANHGRNAARALVDFGVHPAKVLAWDFPHHRTPADQPPKQRQAGGIFRLLYVGGLSGKKGVGDLIRAVAALRDRADVRLDLVGAGARPRFEALARRLGVADRVHFVGLVPNHQVPAMMHAADAVVVPSRHSFPEGLPLTLFEGLASRTPVIASDHPMFAGHLVDGESALIFRAGKVGALADAVLRLAGDPDLYARLSLGSAAAWARMQNPVKWGDMLDHWLRDTAEDRAWLVGHGLAPPTAVL
ncbi:glycosyltransferase family 4 protein [Sphingomonas sp. Leaf25]|uniref:glycosyltransferase family 4 protein n=1 Tax=Sphingomonas sp. Leaf25 TaxID=1735692 RepID=UPI0006F25C31|nr:glycosyltransferase family 4 protein [Sphingomonas sp. Leaf25]KQN04289.1 hypothetical protein ASE78_17100 [Sphingomonas sp. Leaf25]